MSDYPHCANHEKWALHCYQCAEAEGHAAGRAEAIAEVVADAKMLADGYRLAGSPIQARTADDMAHRYERGEHLPAKAKEEP